MRGEDGEQFVLACGQKAGLDGEDGSLAQRESRDHQTDIGDLAPSALAEAQPFCRPGPGARDHPIWFARGVRDTRFKHDIPEAD